jgi:hypothetical protein
LHISNIRSKTQPKEKTRKTCYYPKGQRVAICEGIIDHTRPMPSSPHIRGEMGKICARKCPKYTPTRTKYGIVEKE